MKPCMTLNESQYYYSILNIYTKEYVIFFSKFLYTCNAMLNFPKIHLTDLSKNSGSDGQDIALE